MTSILLALNEFEISWLPALVEPRLERPVKPKECVPTFAWTGLHPVAFIAGVRPVA